MNIYSMFRELAKDQKRLLISFFLFGFAAPMASIYTNTFLWRQSEDPITLAVFNIGIYLGIIVGFLLNTFLLRRFQSGRLYALGCVLQGIVPIVLIALGARADVYAVSLGLALGLAQGFFWGNRNALTSKFTHGPHRYRFISMETILGITAGIISPLLIGWFIASGETLSTYTINQAYQLTSVFGFVLLIVAGILVAPFTLEPFTTKQFFLGRANRLWNRQRLLELINGISDGMSSVLPLVVILLFLGQEEVVGMIKALAFALSAAGLYAIGKRVQHHHHTMLVSLWMLFNIVGGIIFAVGYSSGAALAFFVLSGLMASLKWFSFASVMYEVVDQEIGRNGSHRFLYLLDREFFLNFGRVCGLLLLIVLFRFDQEFLIRYGLLVMAMIPVPLLFLLSFTTNQLNVAHEDVANVG